MIDDEESIEITPFNLFTSLPEKKHDINPFSRIESAIQNVDIKCLTNLT